MLKYSSILLVVAVAISWSQVECKASLNGRYARLFARGIAKRSVENDSDEARNEQDKNQILKIKGFLAAVLELKAENQAEQELLHEKFEKEIKRKHDSFDEYAENVGKIFKEVTGRNLRNLREA